MVVDTGSFAKPTADVERMAADLAAMRTELAAFGESVTTLRTKQDVREAVHAGPAPAPRRAAILGGPWSRRPGGNGRDTCAWPAASGGRDA